MKIENTDLNDIEVVIENYYKLDTIDNLKLALRKYLNIKELSMCGYEIATVLYIELKDGLNNTDLTPEEKKLLVYIFILGHIYKEAAQLIGRSDCYVFRHSNIALQKLLDYINRGEK